MIDLGRLRYLYSVIALVLVALVGLSYFYERALSEADYRALKTQAELLSVRFAKDIKDAHYRAVGDVFGSESPNLALVVADINGKPIFKSREEFVKTQCAQSSPVDGKWIVNLCRVDGPFQSFMSEIRKRAFVFSILAALIVGLAIFAFILIVKKAVAESLIEIGKATGRSDLPASAPLPKLLTLLRNQKHSIEEYQKAMSVKARFAAIGEVSAQFSHDIRNPIHVLGIAVADTSGNEQLRVAAKKALERVRQMVREMKNFSGSLRVEIEPVDLHSVAAEIVSELSIREAAVKGEISGMQDVVVQADRTALHRILSNIVNNSIEAQTPRILLDWKSSEDGWVELKIHDWGQGIPKDVKDRIATAFTSVGKDDGTGLGLWHATQVIGAMGGKFEIQSPGIDGASTTVVIRLLAAV